MFKALHAVSSAPGNGDEAHYDAVMQLRWSVAAQGLEKAIDSVVDLIQVVASPVRMGVDDVTNLVKEQFHTASTPERLEAVLLSVQVQ